MQAACRHSDRVAIIDGQVTSTYGDLDRRSNALANRLSVLGCAAGEHIAVWLPNSHEVAEAFMALEKGGYVRLPIDAAENADFARRIMETYRPAAIIAAADLLEQLDRAWWPGVAISVGSSPAAGSLPFEALACAADAERPGVEVDDGQRLQTYVRMVAGSDTVTVEHTHRNWRHEWMRNQLLYLGGWYGSPPGDGEVFLNVQQLLHGTGIMGFYPLHLLGHPVVMLPRFDPERVLDTIAEHRVTTTFLVPAMLERLQPLAATGRRDLSSLRRVLYGGAPISRESLTRCIDTFGDVLVQLYGRFEGTWPITILDQRDHREMRDGRDELWGSCGRIAPLIEVRIAGTDGELVELGAPGEVVVRCDGVVPSSADGHDWCHTTDLVVEVPAKCLRIVGRTDDMINTGGYHVYPREVEAVLAIHPAVDDVRVLGLPDARWGEAVTACVVLRPGHGASADLEVELVSHARARLSPYKTPKAMHFLDPQDVQQNGGLRGPWLKQRLSQQLAAAEGRRS
jgi:acyl-CoA synthetase (AMP-forming)/AMP-acid ligase II